VGAAGFAIAPNNLCASNLPRVQVCQRMCLNSLELGSPSGLTININECLHLPFIGSNDVKRGFAGQCAAAVLNCAAQADIVCAGALRRIVR
jgi:hypothetical protein